MTFRGMTWDIVLSAMLNDLAADPYFASVFTAAKIRLSSENSAFDVPCLEGTLIADTQTEIWEPMTVQFDMFHPDLDVLLEVENQLRLRYHTMLPIEIGGVPCFAAYADGSMLETPGRDSYFGRGVRFRITPLSAAHTEE